MTGANDGSFEGYAALYDSFYADKDYKAEADYIITKIESIFGNSSLSVLEFGSGTGKYCEIFATRGHEVLGVEKSRAMLDQIPHDANYSSVQGDVRDYKSEKQHDVILGLFHIVNYLSSPLELAAGLETMVKAMRPGALLMLETWHGPAVDHLGPESREKTAVVGGHTVRRTGRPAWNKDLQTIDVKYLFDVRDPNGRKIDSFQETHKMRYIYPNELRELTSSHGLNLLEFEEFMTGKPPGPDTWSVLYVFQLHS